MRVELKKFGTMLISRPSGREALLAFQPTLKMLSDTETIDIFFDGVTTFSPSWGDEFLSPLQEKYGEQRLVLHASSNLSVRLTLELLEESCGFRFTRAEESEQKKGGK